MRICKKGFTATFFTVLFLLMFLPGMTVFAAPGLDSKVCMDNAMAILKEYDPEGYYIVDSAINRGTNVSVWLRAEHSNAFNLDTLVHESYHDYKFFENYYFGPGKGVVVPENNKYKTENYTKNIPVDMRTFRYDTYVSEGAYVSANVDGIYGLLNELSAYQFGMRNQLCLFPYYEENQKFSDFFNCCISDYQAYEEFRYWMLGLLNYEKENVTPIYNAHMKNAGFIEVYCLTTERFRDNISKFTSLCQTMQDDTTFNPKGYAYWLEYLKEDYGINKLEKACSDPALASIENEIFARYRNSQRNSVREYVSRLYQVALGREAEEAGLEDWSDKLLNGSANAVDVVYGVMCSPEYLGSQKSNEQIITDCYKAMLDRDPDQGGFDDWKQRMESGMSINAIFAGFVGSQEFDSLCNRYGINPGSYTLTEERDKNAGVTMFVNRLYTQALGRGYDIGGLNYWCGQINSNPTRDNILDIATEGFFHSKEFQDKNLDNAEFVKVCYLTYLGRECEKEGFDYWVGLLERGEMSRDQVMKGFAYSLEFSEIMASYGL